MRTVLTIRHDLALNTGASGVAWQVGQEYKKRGRSS